MRSTRRIVSKQFALSLTLIAMSGSPLMAAGECAKSHSPSHPPKDQMACIEAKIDKLMEAGEFRSAVLRSLGSVRIESMQSPDVCMYKENSGSTPSHPIFAVQNCGETKNEAFRFRILPF